MAEIFPDPTQSTYDRGYAAGLAEERKRCAAIARGLGDEPGDDVYARTRRATALDIARDIEEGK